MENPNGNANNDYEHDNMSQSTHMHQIEKKKWIMALRQNSSTVNVEKYCAKERLWSVIAMNVKYFPQVYKPQNQQHPALHVCRESSRNAKHARKPLACGRNLRPECCVMHMTEILYHKVKCALIFHIANVFSCVLFSTLRFKTPINRNITTLFTSYFPQTQHIFYGAYFTF